MIADRKAVGISKGTYLRVHFKNTRYVGLSRRRRQSLTFVCATSQRDRSCSPPPRAPEGAFVPRGCAVAQAVRAFPPPQRRCRPYRPGQALWCCPGSLARQVGTSASLPAPRLPTELTHAQQAKFLLGLLKNAQSNAEVNGLDINELESAFPPRPSRLASTRLLTRPPPSQSPASTSTRHPRPAEGLTAPTDVSTLTRVRSSPLSLSLRLADVSYRTPLPHRSRPQASRS